MKRLFPIMCTLLLLYCPFGFAAIVWDGTSKAPWTKGSGTESDPYLIETPEQLAFLSDKVSASDDCLGIYFTQTNDFDMGGHTFVPIGVSSANPFKGTYNGNNKSISNLMLNGSKEHIALFGCIIGATISNLTIGGSFGSTSSGMYVASIAGYGENTSLINCKNTADINLQGGTMAGIIAYIRGICILSNCSNTATIIMSGSTNASPYVDGVGGIVGGNDGDCTLIGCSNMGSISSTSIVGGIIGYNTRNNTTCTLSNCLNSGAILSNNSSAGGLVGHNLGYNEYNTVTCVVTNCSNTGTISSNGTYCYTGGIVGYNYHSRCTLTSCYNTGMVSAPSSTYASGLVSSLYSVCKINNCYARCTVRGKCACGITTEGNVTNSYFAGTLTGQNVYYIVGGTATNCYFNSDCGVSEKNGCTAVTTDQFKSTSMPLMLNASSIREKTWKMDMANSNDGYPILNWQITYKIMGVCNAEQGSVCGSGNYAEGMVVALTATPKDGYAFLGWSDGDKTNPRSVMVGTTDATYTALFVKIRYIITINQDCSVNVQ